MRLPSMVAMVALLGGCGQAPTGNDAGTGAANRTESAAADNEPAVTDGSKFNGYVKGYNTLLGTFGLQQQYDTYLGQRVAQKGVGDSVIINVGWLDNALDELKTARAVPCKCRGLDDVGDRMVPVLERLVGRLKGLETYYASRAYYRDGMARGKSEDPLVIADFKAALALMQPLADAIDVVQAQNDAAELADLKRQGDRIGYQGGLALQRGKALLAMFDAPEDMRNPNQLTDADRIADQLEAALAATRTALAAGKGTRDPGDGLRDSMYDSVAGSLTAMVGHYRGFRRSRATADYQMMVASYNEAIEHANYAR